MVNELWSLMCCVCFYFVFQAIAWGMKQTRSNNFSSFVLCDQQLAMWTAVAFPDLTHQNVHLWAFVCAVCGYVHVHALFVLVGAMMCLPVCHNVHLCVPWCALVCVTCVTSPSICISSVLDFINYKEYTLCFQNWFEYTLCLCVCAPECACTCVQVLAYVCVLVCLCAYAQTFVYLTWSGLADLFLLLCSVTISLTLWAAVCLHWPHPLCVC